MIEPRIRIFHTAAAVGSFTEAAAMLGMSQPNVTQQIARLEKELKVRLFHRDGRKIELTPAGEALLRECRHLFSLESDILRKVRSAEHARRSYMLGGTSTAGSFLLPGLAAAFQKKYGNVSLYLKISDAETVRHALAAGEMELAVTDEPYDGEYFFHEPYCRDRLVPVFAPGYAPSRFSVGEYIRRGGKLILGEPGEGARDAFSSFLREKGLPEPEAENVTEVNSPDAVKQLSQAACGVAVLSALAVENEVRTGILRQGAFTEGEIVRQVDFLYLPEGDQHFIRRFIDFCRMYKSIALE